MTELANIPIWIWGAFIAFVMMMLALDLGVRRVGVDTVVGVDLPALTPARRRGTGRRGGGHRAGSRQ